MTLIFLVSSVRVNKITATIGFALCHVLLLYHGALFMLTGFSNLYSLTDVYPGTGLRISQVGSLLFYLVHLIHWIVFMRQTKTSSKSLNSENLIDLNINE